jgi:uncharacterized protein YdaU (DUF1376 family)
MHYYSFNIGDYASHTRHLSPIEDLAYRRLLDLYYLHEQPLNERSTTVARLINLRDNQVEVQAILEEFFELVEGTGWINQRADDEISKYHGKLEAASRAGLASAAKRSNARSTDVQLNKKQEPITNKQEPIEKKKPIAPPDGVSPATWSDFLQIRKGKKAAVTESAIKGIEREARKAGWSLEKALVECCARGWAGFKAEWVNKEQQQNKTQHQINQEGIARSLGLLPKHDEYQGNVIEGEIYDAEPTTTKRLG